MVLNMGDYYKNVINIDKFKYILEGLSKLK